jgi:predicted permease
MRIEHWVYSVPLRVRSLFRHRQVEQDLDEELQYHLERKIEEYIAQGLRPEQARLAALRSMDGLTQRKEECRDMRRVNAIENTLQDIRYTLRILAKSPGFTATAVLTLALAIGANAVVFGVLNALILRPLKVPQPESLYAIQHGSEHGLGESFPDYLDLRDRNRSFDGLAAFNIVETGVDTGENLIQAWITETSGNYFDVLRLEPYLGRFYHGSDEHGPNSAPYLVLSYGYWHNHFSDDRGVLGRVVRLNKHPFTILGVGPPDFQGTLLFGAADFFVPMVNQEQLEGENNLNDRATQSVFMTIGHLKPGVAPAQAIADLNSIGSYLEKTYPKEHGQPNFSLGRPSLFGDYFGRPIRAFLTGLMLLSGLILLAACANLGSLFAARAADRSREVALRLALGATRSRILRGLFTEAVTISLMGGAVGLLGSVALLHALSAWQPVPRYQNFHVPVSPDASVYAIALILALVSGLLFGIVPVRQVLRTDPYQIVKSGSRSIGASGRRLTFRDVLLAVQIAICAVLVTSSMVAVRGLVRSLHSNFGFEPRNAMLMETNLETAGYRGDAVPAMQKRMIDAMEKIPGVTSVGLIDWLPLEGASANATPIFDDGTMDFRPSNAVARPLMYRVSPEYFHAAGTALLSGRAFNWHDDQNASRVAVINREFARKVFGSIANAADKHYKMPDGTRVQVVGIAEDGKYMSLTEDPRPAMFLPILQLPSRLRVYAPSVVVRSNRDPQQLAATMRSTLRDLDSGLPSYIETWSQELDLALFPSRMATISLGVLGAMGAMLSITGIFGMAAYSVSRRLRELGIRMALGAQRNEVLQAALGRAVKLLAFGSAAGLLLGILASRVLAHIVYQATPRDPLVLTGVVLAMGLVGLLATWLPAQRALSLDPVTLLREE